MCPQTFVFRYPLPCHLGESQVLRWGGQRVAECLPSPVLHSFLVSQPDTWARSLQRTVCCPVCSPVTHGPSRLLAAALEGCMCVSVCLCLCVLCAHVCVSVSMCVCVCAHMYAQHRYVCAPLHTSVLVWVFVVCPVCVSACGCVCSRVCVHVCVCKIVQRGTSPWKAGRLCV